MFGELSAQSTIKGIVVSNDSLAMVGAMVAVNGGTYYTTCGADGEFSISKLPRKSITIEISFLGYKTFSSQITLSQTETDLGVITLEEIRTNIDQVEVIGKSPIAMQKGDTTQYNATAYKTNPDADAGSLIEKLPGVTIQDDKIEAMGESIKRIYVDGKLFFGDDVAEAIANLPADAIESIQIFDDMSDEAKFTGVDDGERDKVINLVTKSRRDNNFLGRVEASGGKDTEDKSQNRYVLGGNVSYFGAQDRLTITGLMNNVNMSKFSAITEDGSTEDLEDSANSNPDGEIDLNRLGINYNHDSKKLKLSVSYSLYDRSSEYERDSYSVYFPNTNYDSRENIYNATTNNATTTHSFNSRLISYIGSRLSIVFNPKATFRKSSYDINSNQLVIQDNDSTTFTKNHNTQDGEYYQLNGNLIVTYKLGQKKNRRISTSVVYNFVKNAFGAKQKQLEYQKYDTDLGAWNASSSLSDKIIDQQINSNVINTTITYTEPIAPKHNLQVSVLGGLDWGSTDKTVDKYDYDLEEYLTYDAQCNVFERQYHNIGAKLGYTYVFDDFRFNAGVGYKLITQNQEELLPNIYTGSYRFDELSPSLNIKYSKLKTKYFRFIYNGKSILPYISQMQNVINDASQTNLKAGNPDLKQGYRHYVSLQYSSSNIPKSTNFNINLSGETRSNYIANSTSVLSGDTVLTQYANYVPLDGAFLTCPVNLDGYKSANLTTNYSFHLSPIKSNVNLGASITYLCTPSFYQVLNYANRSDMNFRLGVSSNISENVDFNIYSQSTYIKTLNTALEDSECIKQTVYGSLNVIFCTRFVFNTVASVKYEQSTGMNEYDYSCYPVNFSVAYKFLETRQAEFRITAYDVFEQNKNIKQTQSNTAITNTETSTLGRYILARLSYRFNTMSGS